MTGPLLPIPPRPVGQGGRPGPGFPLGCLPARPPGAPPGGDPALPWRAHLRSRAGTTLLPSQSGAHWIFCPGPSDRIRPSCPFPRESHRLFSLPRQRLWAVPVLHGCGIDLSRYYYFPIHLACAKLGCHLLPGKARMVTFRASSLCSKHTSICTPNTHILSGLLWS